MQVLDGIWQVDGLRASHVYLVAAETGIAVIDTGVQGSTRAIMDEVRRAGFTPQDVHAIVLTHAHIDHIGSLPDVYARTGAAIYASTGEAAAIEGRTPLPNPPGLHGVPLAIANRFLRPQPVAVQHLIHPAAPLHGLPGWYAVSTPGHTPDHISLYHAERGILIAGDALANMGGLRRSPWIFTSDMRRARASVALLAGLAIQHILFGHGAPLLHDPTLTDQLGRLAQRDRSRLPRTGQVNPK